MHMSAYSAAKSAVAGLTRELAREYRDADIRVNAVAPATVRTADNVAQMGDAKTPFVELEDVVNTVVFLASDEASAIQARSYPSPARRTSAARGRRRARNGSGEADRPSDRRRIGAVRLRCRDSLPRLGTGAEETAQAVRSAGRRAELFQADLGDAAAARALADQAARSLGASTS